MPRFLVVGATGMTGRHVVKMLLEKDYSVRVIVRREGILEKHDNLEVVKAAILDLSDSELDEYTKDCVGVISCLGHVMSFNGIWGQPRDLVTRAIERLCESFKRSNGVENNPGSNLNGVSNVRKIILMNTVGVTANEEKRTMFDNCLLSCLRGTIPPHRDNENAVSYLQSLDKTSENVESASKIALEWVVVRPDTLTESETVSPYEVLPSPVTTVLNGNDIHRINVAHFMVSLALNEGSIWKEWRFKFPVLMNKNVTSTEEQNGENQRAWE